MIPLGDESTGRRVFPIVTVLLIAVNVLVFLYQQTLGAGLEAFWQAFAAQSNEIRAGQELHTLLTSIFLHGDWLHLISNMLYLWIFGDNVEDALGQGLYLVFYLLGGIVAGLANTFMTGVSAIPSLGASGAIGAILGAYLVMFPNQRVRVLVPGRGMGVGYTSALVLIGMWAVLQFIGGFGTLGSVEGGVGYWAHIGGFVFGVVVGYLLRGMSRQRRMA